MKAVLTKHEWELFERLHKLHKAGAMPKIHLRALLRTKQLYEDVKADIIAKIEENPTPINALKSFEKTLDDMLKKLQESVDTFNKELSEAEFAYITSEFEKRQTAKTTASDHDTV